MKKIKALLFGGILLFLPAAPAAAQELLVSTAASLSNAMNSVKAEFEQLNPGVRVTVNYASSGALFRQIKQGAPVDVYASANPQWMNEAVQGGFVQGDEAVIFAHNTLVLAVPAANRAAVAKTEDLKGERVRRIGVGTPTTVPAGAYAKTALTDLGLWEELLPKLIFAENVRQVLDYVRRGEVDAGLMYATDAARGGERVKVVATLSLPQPVSYSVASLKDSREPELAGRFVQFILSDQGQEILAGHGFKR
ncbi:molybdate ABC transporter substrate-binding protein [Desulfurivibrio alkaliphilus]|uniref:Molybdenum ABC transporter, periplasmic molybdate-binding protein n=1 Tax=Desulfurivibrio alkaliphilus (strain DSM 19089 / UNIQEM U267 / AHT2) TaxID=589865 RepID=D6Z0D2_DESAT|nr:molybdate ABC transporter substrate-binding protein [Desulfurivibrio alkaliphilus]ADH87165.1 molybdenum ABC transporter, periplasmic molybdate-binding protein [Desulfurivibrio alkaliphilus AHT 2]